MLSKTPSFKRVFLVRASVTLEIVIRDLDNVIGYNVCACTWSDDALCFASEHSWYMAAMNETDIPRLLVNVPLLHVTSARYFFLLFFSARQSGLRETSLTKRKIQNECLFQGEKRGVSNETKYLISAIYHVNNAIFP